MKFLPQTILMIFMLLSSACSDSNEIEFNIDEVPEFKPFYNACGQHKGVNGVDLHLIELTFKPKKDIPKIMSELDLIAKKENWDTVISQERKRCFVKIDQSSQIENTIVVATSEDDKTLQVTLQKINKMESNQQMHNIQRDASLTPLEL